MRTEEQCRRLAFEENRVRDYFPECEVHDRTGNPYYNVWIREREFRNPYRLRLGLSARFPDSQPSLCVESPQTLKLKEGGTINSLGVSVAYHVHGTRDGLVEICFADDWIPSYSCVLAFWRARIWIAAYEVHLVTGRTINWIIDEWRKHLNDGGS